MIGDLVDATLEVLGSAPTLSPTAEVAPDGLSRRFSAAEMLVANLDTVDYPWTVQIEARVEGTIDAERLRAAMATALVRHPMGLARRARAGALDTTLTWEQASAFDVDPLTELHATDDGEHSMLRSALFGTRIPLEAAPLVRLWLIHRPGGDSIVLSVSHVLADGIGALRLLRSIAREYGDLADGRDPVGLDEAFAVLEHSSIWQRALSVGTYLGSNPVQVRPASRVAVDRSEPARATVPFVFWTDLVSGDDLGRLSPRRHVEATVNDLLLASFHLAIEDWNADHSVATGRVGVMMPVNLRGAEWWTDVVANLASATTVSTNEADRRTPETLLGAITRQTQRIRSTGAAKGLEDVLGGTAALPMAVKRFLPVLLPLTADRLVDTVALSNLGVAGSLEFGKELGVATELWFSPPARMPLGVGLGAVTHEGALHLTFRCCEEQFDLDAAASFSGYYRRALEFLG